MSQLGSELKKLTTEVLDLYKEVNKNKKGEIEVELRMNQEINGIQFSRVINTLPSENIKEIKSEVRYYDKDIRVIKIEGERERWERKIKERPINFKNLGFRIGIGEEIEIKPVQMKENFIRNKRTYQYIVEDKFRYDLSEIREVDKTKQSLDEELYYEIEIEYIGREMTPKDLSKLVTLGIQIQMILDDTEIFMTLEEKIRVTERFNNMINMQGTRLKKIFNKPVDLHFKDLTEEVLLKNPYSITAKADGIRKLLLGLDSGLYFITFNGINKISQKNEMERNYIIDGELINNNYYIFDILYYNDIKLINKDLRTRLSYRENIINKIRNILIGGQDTTLNILNKEFIYFKTANEFFKGVSTLLSSTSFNIDGLIFTPVSSGYYDSKIFKWKPIEKLTIDFQIIEEDPGIGIKNIKNEIIPFKGTSYFPISKSQIQLSNDTQIGDIVEFGWDMEKKLWIPHRLRLDKIEPNYEKVALDILSLLSNPITTETLEGKDLVLMRKYHNRIKSQLYNWLQSSNVSTILDFGSGRGGDVLKWKTGNFSVIAVEPNPDNLQELEKRVIESDYLSHVTIFESFAEEFQCYSPVQAVTMFHSLTFFYDTSSHVDSLLSLVDNCLLPDGYFVVMAVDGSQLRHYFPNDYKGNNITIKYTKSGVIINLENTIVSNQSEYLTNFQDLKNRLIEKSYSIVQDFYLDTESFLTHEALLYSKSTHVLIVRKPSKDVKNLSNIAISSHPGFNPSIIPPFTPVKSIIIPTDTRQVKTKLFRLLPDKSQLLPSSFLNRSWVRIGVISDNSTLLHSILNAFSSSYLSMSLLDRKHFVFSLRQQLSSLFSISLYRSIGNGIYLSLAQNDSTYLFDRLKYNLSDSSYPLGIEFIPLFSYFLNVNIFISSLSDYSLYPLFLPLFDPQKYSLFLYWNDIDIYETLALPSSSDSYQTYFSPSDDIIKQISKSLK